MLTESEKRIYKMLCEHAYSYNEIMEKLFISRSTLRTHITSICKKKKIYGCNRAEKLILEHWKAKVDKYKGYIKVLKEVTNDR